MHCLLYHWYRFRVECIGSHSFFDGGIVRRSLVMATSRRFIASQQGPKDHRWMRLVARTPSQQSKNSRIHRSGRNVTNRSSPNVPVSGAHRPCPHLANIPPLPYDILCYLVSALGLTASMIVCERSATGVCIRKTGSPKW